jgi:ribosomal protein S18 acetylase RimI-like enzyme
MLREFQPRDAAPLIAHYRDEFPEERYLGTNLEEMGALLRRSFGPGPRLLLRTARLFGRPIVRFFVVEENGGMVGTAFLSYLARAGFVALVQVLPEYRRRGVATQLLRACQDALRSARREYVVLDVVEGNIAAQALHDKLGFQLLELRDVLSRETEGNPRPSGSGAGLRPLGRTDGDALAALASTEQSPERARVLPPDPKEFFLRPAVSQALASESEAWVALDADRPAGFIRATVSHIMAAAHITAPLISPVLTPERSRALVDQAVAWNLERGPRRILCEISMTDDRARALLAASGFRPAYRVRTLYRPVSS